jgi:hypothetical protein
MVEKFPNEPANQSVDKLPLKSGGVYVSDTNRKILEPLDWQDGDAIPVEFSNKIREIRDRIKGAPIAVPEGVDPNQRLQPPASIDIKSLSQAEQDELRQILAAAKNDPKISGGDKPFSLEDLDVNIAMKRLKQLQEPAQPVPATEPAAAEEPSAVEEGLYTTCPQCSWDMRDKYETVLTDAEKSGFVAAVLGGQQFYSQVPLFGGKLVLTFRTLTAREEDRIQRQLIQEARDSKLTSTTEWLAMSTTYHRAFSLARIDSERGMASYLQKPAEELSALDVPSVYNEYLSAVSMEALSHAIAKQHVRFRNKVVALESNMADESFW